ncbi:VC0807 family protein [Actinoplanes sp. NPDC051411]|uniref:VC0807 family protein n=1 Tax=Actinoplanes sp. NPDC051411 TaxID=3155522 RepID=UPI00342D4FF8
MNRLSRTLLLDVVAPLAVFYGLRAAGASPLLALLAGAVLPLAGAARDLAGRRRPDGVRVFVLAVMTVTVAASLITGSPRALLVRSAVMMAALGLFLLFTLRARRPFLYAAAQTVLPPGKQRVWQDNWDRHPPFRRLLWLLSAVWALGCLLDAAIRLALALTLPIDSVPALDAALLVATLAVLLAVQRIFGRAYLRRHGLRLRGVILEPTPTAGDRAGDPSPDPHGPDPHGPDPHRPDPHGPDPQHRPEPAGPLP